MNYEIKRVDSSDLPALAELIRTVYGRASLPTNERLLAKFQTGAFGAEYDGYVAYPTAGAAARAGRAVPAAYYGVFPTVVRFGAEEVLCAQSGDTMTHPDHRGKGLFIELARKTYATARQDGIQFVFGFPSPASYPGFSKKLEWKFPFEMLRFTRLVPTAPVGLLRQRLGISSVGFGAFGRSIAARLFTLGRPTAALWTDQSGRPPGIVRDHRFWNYKESGVLFARAGRAGIALKFDGDVHVGEIMGDASQGEMRRIAHRLDALAALTGAVRIKSYFSPDSRLHRLLAPLGRCGTSLPYGFVNFSCAHDPATLDLAYVDYDTF